MEKTFEVGKKYRRIGHLIGHKLSYVDRGDIIEINRKKFEEIDPTDLFEEKPDSIPMDNFNNPLAALRDVLPDVWGRKENEWWHSINRISDEHDQSIQKDKFYELRSILMWDSCGPLRMDKAVEEPPRPDTKKPKIE